MRYIFIEAGDGSLERVHTGRSIRELLHHFWLDNVRDARPADEESKVYDYLKLLLESRNHWPPGRYDLNASCGDYGWLLLVVPDDGDAWREPDWYFLNHHVTVYPGLGMTGWPGRGQHGPVY